MKAEFKYGRSNDLVLRGWPAIICSLVYILGWALIASAVLKTAWEIVFGGLLG